LANLESARGELRRVKLSWLPALLLLAGYSTYPGFGVPGALVGAWPTYMLNLMQQFKLQQQAIFNVDYYAAMVNGVRLTIIGQTASAYFTMIAQQEQLTLLKKLEKNIKGVVKLYQDDIGIGLKNDIDIKPWLIEMHLISAQISTAEHNIVVSKNALHYLIDENPGSLESVQHFSSINFKQFKPSSLPTAVLRNRPDVIMAAYSLKKARAGIDLAVAEFFPVLKLSQFMGQVTQPRSEFAQFTDAYFTANLDPSTFGKISVRKGEYRAELFKYVKTIRKVLNDVDNDFSANEHYSAAYDATLAAENDSRANYGLKQGLLDIGLISDEELLVNRIALNRLELFRNQAQLQLAISLVRLYEDLAGGVYVKI